jgi:hypothetical protein
MKQWLRIRYTKPKTYVTLTVPVGPGAFQTFSAAVDNRMIRAKLSRAGVEVGFLGGLWKGIKKVAKATGITKVLSIAKKALPIAAKFLPPPASIAAAGASLAINTGASLIKAGRKRKKGDKKGARRDVRRIAKAAARAKTKLGAAKTSAALKTGGKLYRLTAV